MSMVDHKTGQIYNPKKEFNILFQNQWFIDQMVRMKNEVIHDQIQNNRKVLK